MVVSNTIVSLNATEYVLPEALDIEPQLIFDNTDNVYRITVGTAHVCTNSPQERMYKALFHAIDQKLDNGSFISNICFSNNGNNLHFGLAFVVKDCNQHGIYYDIEAAVTDAKYNGKDLVKREKTKSKKVSSRGKTTSKTASD